MINVCTQNAQLIKKLYIFLGIRYTKQKERYMFTSAAGVLWIGRRKNKVLVHLFDVVEKDSGIYMIQTASQEGLKRVCA